MREDGGLFGRCAMELVQRLRRNRKSAAVRALVQETRLSAEDFVQPLFIVEGKRRKEAVDSMPEVWRMSADVAETEVRELSEMGLRAVALFPVLERGKKDPRGSEALNPENLVFEMVRRLKDRVPEMTLVVDIALDPYTDHGHDGLVDEKGRILNDETVEILAQMACLAAESGCDIVAPSDMMDGRVGRIRGLLDSEGHSDTSILSYAAKYASSLYGPFREAVKVTLQGSDKKTYQMNPANVREALLECALDEHEGADILMIKPALAYLDVIAKVRENSLLPLAAYHVSGEYSMVMAAHERGWIQGPKVMEEHLLAIKRAGADMIFTYAAKSLLPLL